MTSPHSTLALAGETELGEDGEMKISCFAGGNINWHNQSVKVAARKV